MAKARITDMQDLAAFCEADKPTPAGIVAAVDKTTDGDVTLAFETKKVTVLGYANAKKRGTRPCFKRVLPFPFRPRDFLAAVADADCAAMNALSLKDVDNLAED